MSKRQNEDITRFIALVHDEEQTFPPTVVVMNNIAEGFRELMTESFVFCVKMCH
jgi:hypothetical protein